ncbi:hypothetical protein EI94DRAFT_1707332 [Lactarius quietus]|nr:hypothetical protein EI94DRAFT_1707332 [Lactarius quietus]
MPLNARFILLLAFVHSSAFAAAIPLESWRVSDTVIEDGTLSTSLTGTTTSQTLGMVLSLIDVLPRSLSGALGKRDPPGPGPEAPPGPPSAAAATTPVKMGPPSTPPQPMFGPPGPRGPAGPAGSSSPGPPLPYPYPYPYPFPITEHEPERKPEYPHKFHGHEEFMDHENMYHEFPAHEYSHNPHDDFSRPRPHHDSFPYDDYSHPHQDGYFRDHDLHSLNQEYCHLHDDFPSDHYPHPHKPSRKGQHMGGPEIATDNNKRLNAISLPQASSVDLTSAQPPPHAEPDVPDASNASPSVSSLFSELGSQGDSAVPHEPPSICGT